MGYAERISLGIVDGYRQPQPELAQPHRDWIQVHSENRTGERLAPNLMRPSQITESCPEGAKLFEDVNEKRTRPAGRVENLDLLQTVNESRWKCEQRKCINKESNVTPFMNSDFDFTFAYESRCVEYARLVSATQIQIPEVTQ